MAMKPYSFSTIGRSQYWDSYDGSTTLATFPLSQRALYSVATQRGDFHSPTPHAYTKHAWRGWYGRVSNYSGGRLQSQRTGAMPWTYSSVITEVDTNFSSNVLAAAIGDAYSKLRGETDLSIDLVQWRQMLQMAVGYKRLVLKTIAKAFYLKPHVAKAEMAITRLETGRRQRLSRRRLKRLAREANASLNFLANQRLAYVYGISPTMQSCYDLAEMAITPKEPGHIRVEGKARDILHRIREKSDIDPKVAAKHCINASYRARVVMYFSPAADTLERLSEISSLNPASILYELTPFSFVLDWAVDFGGWIRTLETAFMHQNNFAGGYQTQTLAINISSVMTGINTTNVQVPYTSYEIQGAYTMRRLLRSGLASPPFPTRPVGRLSLGVERSLNAIALAKSTFLRADELLRHKRF